MDDRWSGPGIYEENLADFNSAAAAPDHIRLLRPSRTKRNPQVWRLKVFSLRKAPPFAALSYSWGDRASDMHIKLDTGNKTVQLPISEDLASAVVQLKKTNELRWLWIDAICIDQSNNNEKSNQVSMMRSIYHSAKCLYVWLGKAMADPVNIIPGERLPFQQRTLDAGITEAKAIDWAEQGTRVWWQRSWVVQEVVSCETAFVCIGPHCTPWDNFWHLLSTFLDDLTIHGSRLKTETVRAAARHALDISTLRRDLQGKPAGESIFRLLRKTPNGVSNPLDRVYSLLGVASSIDRANIYIEYGKPLAHAFTEVVVYGVETQENNDILFEGWANGVGDENTDPYFDVHRKRYHSTIASWPRGRNINWLPTWMPNFMQPFPTPLAPWLEFLEHKASLDTLPDVVFQFGSLYMRALHFDVMDQVECRLYSCALDDVINGRAQGPLFPQTSNFTSGPNDPRTELVSHKELREVLDIMGPQVWSSKNWSCFSTKRGLVGLTLRPVYPGYKIIVPFGSSTPVIVKAHKDDAGQSVYNLVGDCYVDGIMNGELMDLYYNGQIESMIYHLR